MSEYTPIWIGLIALLVPVPLLFLLLSATTLGGFIAAYSAITLFSMSWAGPFAAEAIGLVLVRMRGTTSAIFSLVMILLLGEYLIPTLLGGGKVFFIGNALVDLFLQSRNWPFGSALAMTLVAMMLLIIGLYLKLVARYGGRPADGGL